ncbi:hypothetical protein Ahy_A09g045794 [Arachis hypogaea]|uniref:Aminotransferase-like plant mobile domain-containing protein n=1 Tax=Arachis hypogaea TaxID=3818 RepID=A0A445BN66_ARAHY|nr:hypothetical protein Ahy_A09g045794 [Arachis hypogaea]
MGTYSWGSGALAWLYRCMCQVANRNVTNLAGPLWLLLFWIFWQFPTLRPHGFDYFSFLLASSCQIIYSYNVVIVQCRLALDRLVVKIFYNHLQIVWEPYAVLDVLVVVNPEIQLRSTIGYDGG